MNQFMSALGNAKPNGRIAPPANVRSPFLRSTALASGFVRSNKMEEMTPWIEERGDLSNYRTLPCVMCGDETTACIEYSLIHEHAQVCYKCADIVVNAFFMKHSGEYFSWPNERHQDDRYRPRKKISATVRTLVMERDKYRCVKCESHIELQLDHVFPHSKGGSDDPENLQTLCGVCNRLKKDKIEVAA